MGLIFIASACLSIMAFLIGTVLTEFTDAFWNQVDFLAGKAKRLARDQRGSHRISRNAAAGKHTGR